MNHAERVKELVEEYSSTRELHGSITGLNKLWEAIDAMQSALDDAAAKRDEYMGLWAALSQDEGKAERAIAELEAKLAARDAEVERLRKDSERYRWLLNHPEWLGWDRDFRPDEVEREINASMSEEVKGGE